MRLAEEIHEAKNCLTIRVIPVFEREARVQYFVTFDHNSKQYSWYLREDDENILELVSDTVIFEGYD